MIPGFIIDPNEQIIIERYPSFTYKVTNEQISGDIDDATALRQTVLHILNTERYAHPIYDDNYGFELAQFIGESFEYLEVTIEAALQEALLQDDRILNVTVINVQRGDDLDSALIEFNIDSIYGTITGMEFEIVQPKVTKTEKTWAYILNMFANWDHLPVTNASWNKVLEPINA